MLAGLTPYEALRTGTVDVATYFGLKDAGTIAAGKKADLILLDASPLENITNSAKIAGVVIGGRLPKAGIQDRLERKL